MPLPPGAKTGRLPDGTLVWIDANGNPINPDGTPMEGATATPLTPAPNTATGGIQTPVGTLGGSTAPAPAAASTAPAAPAKQRDPNAKTQVGSAEFIKSLGLNPEDGWKVSGVPVQKTTTSGAATVNVPGQYTVQVVGPRGESRTVTLKPQGGDAAIGSTPLDQVDWDVAGIDQTVAPATKTTGETDAAIAASQAQVEQAKAAAAKSAADLAQVQKDNAERDKNLAKTGLALTDKERADQENQLRSQGLQQAQIDAQLKIASDNNRNSAAANEIAAQNANTNAQVAAHNAVIDDARVKLGNDQLSLDQAKQVFTEEQAAITNTRADSKQALDELTQRQANAIAQQQVDTSRQSNVLRGQEAAETTRHNTVAEAQQAAATEATARAAAAQTSQQAAGNILTGVNNAAQVGAGLLQNRVTAATGALNNVVGQLGGGNLGGATRLPSGWGSNLVNGLQEWVTDLGGGQPVYDSAAAMVNNANPSISGNPTLAQQAYTALRGMMDLYKAQNGGQPHPLDQQLTQQAQAAAGVTAPNTAVQPQTNVGVNQALATQQAAAAQAASVQPGPTTAQLNARGLLDTPQGRAIAAGQTPVAAGVTAPITAGMYNPAYQQGITGAAGRLATGPVVGNMVPLPIPTYAPAPILAPVTA